MRRPRPPLVRAVCWLLDVAGALWVRWTDAWGEYAPEVPRSLDVYTARVKR